MTKFDIHNKIDRDVRHCKTRALAARLHAPHPINRSNAGTWEEVANAWDDLAMWKAYVAETEARIRQAQDYLTAALAKHNPTP